jgi:putative redox protein
MSEVTVTSLGNLQNEVRYGESHTLISDEPLAAGGDDAGPDPYTLLLAALGSCISMTTALYAQRKGWPLERVTSGCASARIHVADCIECRHSGEDSSIASEALCGFHWRRPGQHARQEIAHKCPVHRTLTSKL